MKRFVFIFVFFIPFSLMFLSEQVYEYDFSSFPTKACIFVDKARVGFTPLSLNLSEGMHEIIAKKEGYEDKIMVIKVDEFSRKSINLKLPKDKHLKPVMKQCFLTDGQGHRKENFNSEDNGVYFEFYIDNWISKKRISYKLRSVENEMVIESEGKVYEGTVDWVLKGKLGYDFSGTDGAQVMSYLKMLPGSWRVEIYVDYNFLDSRDFTFSLM